MARFMIVTFLLLGWGFFELSGGADFVAPEAQPKPLNALLQEVAQEEETLVARADTSNAGAAIVQPNVSTQNSGATLASFTPSTSLATVLGEAAAVVEPEVEEVAVAADIRAVTGSRVNMRNGPGTNYQVITQLLRGDEAEVLQIPGNGWVKIRVSESGRVGWMAERLMRSVN